MIPFFPVRFPILNDKINYRNHRKIVIIDGNEGFVGGLNIGDEYLGKDKYFGFGEIRIYIYVVKLFKACNLFSFKIGFI